MGVSVKSEAQLLDEIARLRAENEALRVDAERYDDLLAKHQEVLDTVQQCACAYDGPKDVCVGHAKEMAALRERVKVLESELHEVGRMAAESDDWRMNTVADRALKAARLRGGSDE